MNIIDSKIYDNFPLLPEDTQGWHGNSPLFEELIKELSPSTIIEVGTWKGQSAINMGKIVKNLGLNTTIYCIDTWLGAIEFWHGRHNNEERNLMQLHGYPQIYYQFLSNVIHNNLQDIILPFPNTSINGYRYLSLKSIKSKLIYIDASHEEDDVYNDIHHYSKLLEHNGIIFGDDYYNFLGVKKAVDKFVEKSNYNLEIKENNFWVLRK